MTCLFLAAPSALDDTGNYRLAADSPYRNAASDGKDVGVNYDVLVSHLGYDPNSGGSGTGGSGTGGSGTGGLAAPSNLRVQ